MSNKNSVPRKTKFMTPSAMAKCFGVSLPTFYKWLKHFLYEDETGGISFYQRLSRREGPDGYITLYYYKCVRRIITPREVIRICTLLGDPDCILNYSKTTISSLALEAGINIKTAKRVIRTFNDENPIINWNLAIQTRCLIPKHVKIVRELMGLD